MKIVHVINYFQPQLGYQETFLAKEQLKSGHDVRVVTSDRYYPFSDYEDSYSKVLGPRRRRCGSYVEEDIPVVRLRAAFEFKFRVWLINLEHKIRELDPDIVIVHALLANAFRLMRLKKRGATFRLIVDEHLIDLVRCKLPVAEFYNRLKKNRLQAYWPYVDKFVGVTGETCELLAHKFGIPAERISQIPLGADSRYFKTDLCQREKMRAKYHLSDDNTLLLYTGKINKQKGVETVLNAFVGLAGDRSILWMVGGGDKHYIRGLLDRLPVNTRARIRLESFVPNHELSKYFNAADICVWGDTISGGMLEAMSCSRPIVGCGIAPFYERIQYQNGLAYDIGDAHDLSQKLKSLIDNPKLRIEMGERGRKLVEDKFSWARIAEEFIAN